METILTVLTRILWGPPVLALFLGTGLYFTVRSRFFQLRWGTVLRGTFGSVRRAGSGDGAVSPLRTLSAALGACMGTGNIAGVGTAIMSGGAGALFWMCVSAFFGMMTSFSETVIAVRYRQKDGRGQWVGGAMYALEKGLGMKKTAMLYAALLTASSFGVGNMSQVNAAASALHGAFGVSPVFVGAVFCALIALTVCGGFRRICAVTEKAVPLLSAVFLFCALAALFVHRAAVPDALRQIWTDAWDLRAAAGGFAGSAVRVGVTRGVFSNEAGLGSTAVIHAAADTDSPVGQGLWGVVEVFLDTVLMCTFTGLVILTAGAARPHRDGAELFADALCVTFGKAGGVLTAVTLALLGFASLTGWSYCGERGAAYLCGERRLIVYRALYAAAAFFGSFLPLDTVFRISDVLNCLTALPNLLCVWLLSGTVFSELRRYKEQGIDLYSHHRIRKEKPSC
ncbi:MAG: sodium:alanine symporter family protein [Clostridia bacterium]|nr:sodium:alanine symporter family protein [Clostridia bacterium]